MKGGRRSEKGRVVVGGAVYACSFRAKDTLPIGCRFAPLFPSHLSLSPFLCSTPQVRLDRRQASH